MLLAQNTIRDRLKAKVEKIAEKTTDEAVKAAAAEYLETYTVALQMEQLQTNLLQLLKHSIAIAKREQKF